ncbi:MAG: esterase/lipase family protein [Gemmatimonadaceae bacterium]
MAAKPIVLVHGYSSGAPAFDAWRSALISRGFDPGLLHACSYRSLTNEVTIRDIAEGFDRALGIQAGLDEDQPFDAIVHSTGMLVLRAWLSAYPKRRSRLKHLIALAPATFGSPLAHKGRSWMGAMFKGNRQPGPDFLEAGDRILSGLELGSRFTWDLAHEDVVGPWVFVFCGTESYRGLRRLAHEPGTDGAVRWAGCALNTRKIILDLTEDPARKASARRISIASWKNIDAPLVPVEGKNHSTILSDPGDHLVDLVARALEVEDAGSYKMWQTRARPAKPDAMEPWQQFVIRALDERGDPIPDFNVQLFTRRAGGRESAVQPFDIDVHAYREDPSLRCFHVNLAKIGADKLENLWIRVMASSGSQLVGYHGYGSESPEPAADSRDGVWDAELDISSLADDRGVRFFFPFTTTLVELRLNREPLPVSGRNQVCFF